MLVGGLVAVAVYTAGYLALSRDQPPTAEDVGMP
jgi:hypothetical protein